MTLLFESIKKEIEKKIESEISTLGPPSSLRDACGYALKHGGKRLRPIIVLLVARALSDAPQAIEAAMAVEFFHTASLIADDLPCMDDEAERRGAPSLHRAFSETVALLASYVLISAGYERLQKFKDAYRLALALASATYNTGITGATGGQFLDLHAACLDEAKLREIVQKKTSSLFELSFVLGWLFGGGDIEKLPYIKKLSSHFGLAFQTADDFADLRRDARKNKPINLPILLGEKRAAEILEEESKAFRETLNLLGLATPEFIEIANYIDNIYHKAI